MFGKVWAITPTYLCMCCKPVSTMSYFTLIYRTVPITVSEKLLHGSSWPTEFHISYILNVLKSCPCIVHLPPTCCNMTLEKWLHTTKYCLSFKLQLNKHSKMSAQVCVLSHIDVVTAFQPVEKDREKTSCTFRLVITQFSTRRLAFISIWSTECQQTVKASTIWQSWGWCIPIACFLWPTKHVTVIYKQKTKNALTLGKAGANESGIFAICQINWLKK